MEYKFFLRDTDGGYVYVCIEGAGLVNDEERRLYEVVQSQKLVCCAFDLFVSHLEYSVASDTRPGK